MKRTGLLSVVLALLLSAPAAAAGDVEIRRTAHGIPHILAKDFEALGYGYGYALAQDNLCVIADSYVTVRGERSRFFGPDATYEFAGNGTVNTNLKSDFLFASISADRRVERLIAEPPPRGPKPEVREAVRGYVAGYNRFLADAGGAAGVKDPACRGKEWVRPIEEIDAYRRFYQLALLASSGVAIDGIGEAQPPTPAMGDGAAARSRARDALAAEDPQRWQRILGGIGSNAVALGSERTENGRGLLLGNPHFPWDGAERFYQAHLKVPGKLDVSGGSLFGVPVVLIGHTRRLAWSHTVSTARRFTPFELKLVPGSPTTYLVDGQPKEMRRTRVTVKARRADGALEDRARTLYSTDYGPMLTSILGTPLFPWTPTTGYALGDVNATNFRYLNHFFDTNRAQSTTELDAIERRYQGIPWVNTIAADADGRAYYADIGAVPNVDDAKIADCSVPLGRATDQALRVQVLDGARSACGYGSAEAQGAVAPGILPPSRMPSLERRDFVTNSNDSYWLSNPAARLEGFPRIIGDERTARTPRTRLGLKIVEEGGRFSVGSLQAAAFNNRQYLGELWLGELLALCAADPSLAEACAALRGWSGRDDSDARGGLLFRRFAERALAVPGGPYRIPYSNDDPVNTPRGLRTEDPSVRQALVDAAGDLRGAGIPLDARQGDFQYDKRGDERIPIHGGPDGLGVFNAINVPFVASGAEKGFPNVPHGTSFVQVVGFDGSPCPAARTILSYSQSADPTSPHFADQTRLYARKQWVTPPFCEKDVRAATLRTTRLRARAPRLLSRVRLRGGRRALRASFRLARRARVTLRITRGGRRVRTVRRTFRAGTRRIVVRPSRRLRAGRRYRLTLSAGSQRVRGSRSLTGRRP